MYCYFDYYIWQIICISYYNLYCCVIIITTGAISISQALMVNQTLLELHMMGNQLGDDGITTIAGSLSNSSITLLNVMVCGISVVGARLIIKLAMDNAVCKDVWLDSDHNADDEVKSMMSILSDRSRQDVSKF